MGQTYNPEEPQTHGIRIEDWPFEYTGREIKAHVWDFGGQDIMHATHQFFFTRRSLYVVLLNAREKPNPEDWLKLIESFGGDSPIIIVINKIDENPSFDINRKFLSEKYKTIRGIYRISCDTTEGIEDFRDALKKELANIEMIRQVWTQNWLKVKQDLEGLQKNYINYKAYRRICATHGVKKSSEQNTLLNYLHELGVVLHFEELGLKDMQVLEPKWVTEAVYKIINSRTLAESKGMLCKDCLESILNKETFVDDAPLLMECTTYTATECGYILELMKKFELCYELDDQRALVPDLLDVEESTFDFDNSVALQFYFKYEFLPRSVIPQFIVRMHKDIEDELHWRTGVVLHCSELGCRAVVRADYKEGRIDIQVSGKQQRDYFAVLRYTIQDLNRQFTKLDVREWIPLPDSEQAVEYDELLGHWLDSKDEYYNGKLRKTFSVRKLLDGIEKPEARKMTDEKNVRHIHVEGDYVEGNQMKMRDNFSGEVVFGDKNIKIEYKEEYGLSPDDFEKLITGLNRLSADQMKQLKELSQNLHNAKTDDEKKSRCQKIKDHLVNFGIGVAGSLTAAAIVAISKKWVVL